MLRFQFPLFVKNLLSFPFPTKYFWNFFHLVSIFGSNEPESQSVFLFSYIIIQYVPANVQPFVNACSTSQYRWSVKIRSFWHYLACFWNRMPQTRSDFLFMFRFYHNFSITNLIKISCKFFTMLSKMQYIFIIEHYLHSNYLTKMSDTFTFNRTEFAPLCQNKPWNFYRNFSMTDSFLFDYGPTKPWGHPIGFFPIGPCKK